ncbi:unnamed protein product [Caenorhabditis auriculariae]|uniref:Ubiquitin-like modifier-activating enzyme ATG7 n=1 Tax=Caenorhabditis auriculariae TaxID=2777116 RepID=A0A8S1H6A0_9PELO|nr:unnamed protein product [Caenorhabditis auriculariae]
MPAAFVPFATFCDTTFWNEVNKKKLNEWMLDETPKDIYAGFSIYDTVGAECRISLSYESLGEHSSSSYKGQLSLWNTLEAFKKLDRTSMIKIYGRKIWNSIKSGEWLNDVRTLFYFSFTAFADLKKFKYVYWSCYPAICYPPDIEHNSLVLDDPKPLLDYHFSTGEVVFILAGDSCGKLSRLSEFSSSDQVSLVIADPSPVESTCGWPVRNLLAAISVYRPDWSTVQLISLRGSSKCFSHIFSWRQVETPAECPAVVGWERNVQGKLQPYSVDLSTQFDPKKLMEQSVDLNLSLIKWRLVPDIKLERMLQLKALILGAGTLGCNLARGLMAWGVKKITFVDNSTVSYSNPVRQSLSEFGDACEGRGKAETAAAALKRIFPSIDAQAVRLTIPMPGHTLADSECENLKKDIDLIESLVEQHDVVFLALDSREARWLPTIIANKHRKIAISVGLGFDTYVVIRHGIGNYSPSSSSPANEATEISANMLVPYSQLSCYFCSDVTAPGNSTNDRTLDQQCTVSRPGLSMVASGVAIELLSSVLQYENPLEAPSNICEADESSSLLGATPHQVRGFIFKFQQITPCVRRFERCVACGTAVSEAYAAEGWKFVREVMNSPSHLERITGLDQLQNSVDNVQIDFSEDSDSLMSL